MRLGDQCLDMGNLADRKHSAFDLLHHSRRGAAEHCADQQHGVDRDDDSFGPTKQQCLSASFEFCRNAIEPMTLKIKRAYEQPAEADGERILVDRLWPRGLTKKKAAIDLWLKEIAPSRELRQWFGHDPEKWKEFRERYRAELQNKKDLVELLVDKARSGTVTLVYGARDEEHNDAVVLKQFLEKLI